MPSKFGKKYFSGKYHAKFGYFAHFSSSRNPGIKASPIPGFGIEKIGRDPGIRDPGIGIPNRQPKDPSATGIPLNLKFKKVVSCRKTG